jgi:hypothetical protein
MAAAETAVSTVRVFCLSICFVFRTCDSLDIGNFLSLKHSTTKALDAREELKGDFDFMFVDFLFEMVSFKDQLTLTNRRSKKCQNTLCF